MSKLTTSAITCLLCIVVTLLFRVSNNVQNAQNILRELHIATQQEQEKVRVLQAEWYYLTTPERLEKLALRYTNLRPQSGAETVALNEIPFPQQVEQYIIAKSIMNDNHNDDNVTAENEYIRPSSENIIAQSQDILPDALIASIKKSARFNLYKENNPIETVSFSDIWGNGK